jgi:hypothetical protein
MSYESVWHRIAWNQIREVVMPIVVSMLSPAAPIAPPPTKPSIQRNPVPASRMAKAAAQPIMPITSTAASTGPCKLEAILPKAFLTMQLTHVQC